MAPPKTMRWMVDVMEGKVLRSINCSRVQIIQSGRCNGFDTKVALEEIMGMTFLKYQGGMR